MADPVLIPIIGAAGFWGWLIAIAASKAYRAKLKAQSEAGAGAGAGQEELAAAVDALRHEVAELAERVDFTERLLARSREGERLAPPG
jgi:hypothetical protein